MNNVHIHYRKFLRTFCNNSYDNNTLPEYIKTKYKTRFDVRSMVEEHEAKAIAE